MGNSGAGIMSARAEVSGRLRAIAPTTRFRLLVRLPVRWDWWATVRAIAEPMELPIRMAGSLTMVSKNAVS